jgi:hypothetical protein
MAHLSGARLSRLYMSGSQAQTMLKVDSLSLFVKCSRVFASQCLHVPIPENGARNPDRCLSPFHSDPALQMLSTISTLLFANSSLTLAGKASRPCLTFAAYCGEGVPFFTSTASASFAL